ncbi:MAG: sigma 54-interacting transcriptional regulator [Candidatus Contendobacter sp.]|nr:sigma 54-interacting transcriptional regulator [Candidatus Contendobacter sp.]MDG4557944.1 sigma 54-interacting transcriptional regulator [Candidatus Contendobacter sp.]
MNETVSQPADRRSVPRSDPAFLPPDERDAMHLALRSIVEGTVTATGTEFFHALVRELAQALNVRHAFVSELLENKARVRTLAFWFGGKPADNIEFDLDGTPCEIVIRGDTVYYTSKVYEMFPRHPELKELGIESYFGVPLVSESGNEMMGHLAVMHDQPMVKEFRGMALLRIFATRARVELERKRAEQALRKSEERLASILASAMDAVITIDAEQRITLFNPAAEKAFRCQAAQAVGQPFETFLSKRFGNLLKGYCLAVQPATVSSRQLWAPEGLTARRRDGEEFPVEATISPLEIEGRRFFTVILRDVTERWRSEETFKQLQLENVYLQEEIKTRQSPSHIVGDSPAMQDVFAHAEQVAGTDSTVLLTGETGTGKSVIARSIHDLSDRRDKLFVPVNCAALPGDLVESELFGHEKGAFTGAIAQRKGRFELADGGTLFLDEVGEMSAGAQAKLLRVLQDQEFERVGGTQTLKVNVRLVAATNRDLARMVKEGGFRADLYYRLNVFPIRLPSLRERPTDIPLLARFFLDKFARKMGKSIHDLSPKASERLLHYSWPGNIRELQNVIERAAILTRGSLLEIDNALELRLEDQETKAAPEQWVSFEDMERAYILKVLERTRWVIEGEQGAAAILDLNPSTLRSRMQKLNIRKPKNLP